MALHDPAEDRKRAKAKTKRRRTIVDIKPRPRSKMRRDKISKLQGNKPRSNIDRTVGEATETFIGGGLGLLKGSKNLAKAARLLKSKKKTPTKRKK